MKEKIQRILLLTKEVSKLRESIDKIVRKIAVDYKKHNLIKDPNSRAYYNSEPQEYDINEWYLDDEKVTVKWGYHPNIDIFSFPTEYIYDSGKFDAFKKMCLKTKEERIKAERGKERKKKLETFEKLKRELKQ